MQHKTCYMRGTVGDVFVHVSKRCKSSGDPGEISTQPRHYRAYMDFYAWVSLMLIYRIFHRLLRKLASVTFYNRYIKLPPYDQVPPEIQSNPKLYPFFRDCLGALDGSHVDAFVPENLLACYRDRKGRLSQNVLAACTFDMRFSYVLP
jgi:hypothetical protein